VGYVLVALMGKVLLNEQITMQRWAGIGLIVAGVALVGGGSAPADRAFRVRRGRANEVAADRHHRGATTAGEVLQAAGMRRHGEIRDFRPGAIGRALAVLARNRFVIAAWRPWRFPSSPTWGC
jgi:hypothetical protein